MFPRTNRLCPARYDTHTFVMFVSACAVLLFCASVTVVQCGHWQLCRLRQGGTTAGGRHEHSTVQRDGQPGNQDNTFICDAGSNADTYKGNVCLCCSTVSLTLRGKLDGGAWGPCACMLKETKWSSLHALPTNQPTGDSSGNS